MRRNVVVGDRRKGNPRRFLFALRVALCASLVDRINTFSEQLAGGECGKTRAIKRDDGGAAETHHARFTAVLVTETPLPPVGGKACRNKPSPS